jgi:hypothetical protein
MAGEYWIWKNGVYLYDGTDKSSALYRKQQATGLKKCIYSTYPPLSPKHTYDFAVITSLTHPRKMLLLVLQIGKREKPKTYQHLYV